MNLAITHDWIEKAHRVPHSLHSGGAEGVGYFIGTVAQSRQNAAYFVRLMHRSNRRNRQSAQSLKKLQSLCQGEGETVRNLPHLGFRSLGDFGNLRLH